MDFVHHQMLDGRAFRVLTVIDQWSCESASKQANFRLTGLCVGKALDEAARERGWPKAITVDNGTEFTSKALDEWAWRRGVKLDYTRPGKPTDNGLIESLSHPPARRHRARRVDAEEHQVGLLALAGRDPQVLERSSSGPAGTTPRAAWCGAAARIGLGQVDRPAVARRATRPPPVVGDRAAALARPRPAPVPRTVNSFGSGTSRRRRRSTVEVPVRRRWRRRPAVGAEEARWRLARDLRRRRAVVAGLGPGRPARPPRRTVGSPSVRRPAAAGGSGSGSGSGSSSPSTSSSRSSSRPGASNGLRRRRCGRASRAAARTSSVVTEVRPCQAAWATAVRAVTMSARIPSTSNAAHSSAIWQQRVVGRARPRRPAPGRPDPLGRARASASAYDAAKRVRVGVVRHPPAHHLDPQRRVARRGHLDGQPEPVEQLRAQLALLGVHRADEHEAGRVLDRDAVALDGRAAHRGGVEQQVDEVVVQQVDLVDVEDPAVRLGQQAGLVLRLALATARARGAASRAPGPRWRRRAARPAAPAASRRRRRRANGRRATGAGSRGSLENRSPATTSIGGSTRGQGAHDRRLRGALLAAHEHAADLGGDRGEHQGQGHVVGADDGAEGEGCCGMGGSRSLAIGHRMMRGARPVFGLPGRPCRAGPWSPQRACAGLSPASQILPSAVAALGAPRACGQASGWSSARASGPPRACCRSRTTTRSGCAAASAGHRSA